jgi:hypothetical protein
MIINIEFIDGDKTVTLQISEAEIAMVGDVSQLLRLKINNALFMLRMPNASV